MNPKCVYYRGLWLDPNSKAYELHKEFQKLLATGARKQKVSEAGKALNVHIDSLNKI